MLDKSRDWLAKLEGQALGEYVLDEYLGQGHVGYLYKARLRAMNDEEIFWAIKLVPEDSRIDANELLKALRLQRIANVVQLHAVGTAILDPASATGRVLYSSGIISDLGAAFASTFSTLKESL